MNLGILSEIKFVEFNLYIKYNYIYSENQLILAKK